MHRIFPTDVKELKSGGEYIRARAKGKWLFFIRVAMLGQRGGIFVVKALVSISNARESGSLFHSVIYFEQNVLRKIRIVQLEAT
ncbi:hypothetical protein C9J03_15600 [Photobacterium gaetbulicola]|nr:hypothetical protein C9J03_15600 [Photobacterium gaetbulicola]